MLTESQKFITDPEGMIKANVGVFLYGKEINPETYAICKSDMMIKGNDPGEDQVRTPRWQPTIFRARASTSC